MAGMLLTSLALSLLTLATAWSNGQQDSLKPHLPSAALGSFRSGTVAPREHSFTLRHIFHHGTRLYPDLHRRLDVQEEACGEHCDPNGFEGLGPFNVHSAIHTIQRLVNRRVEDVKQLLSTTGNNGAARYLPPTAWTSNEVLGPNVTDKSTIISLALMTANAYEADRRDPQWVDVGLGFNSSINFGWENDGLRGHVFADETNSTIVISIKGTSFAVFDGANTTTNDKENDNLFGSCCCGEGGQYLWRQVCHCKISTYTCNQTCLATSLRKPNGYYESSLELYGNVTELFPTADIILVGHSLGGVVASLLGLTFGVPTVTFEAYGQALAAKRLGLPFAAYTHRSRSQAEEYTGGYHFGHTAGKIM